jgi:hypothetical protein
MNAELEKWMDVWEKAQEKGIFPETPKQEVNPQVYQTDYFGNVRKDGNDTVTLNECDVKYWNQVHALAKGGKVVTDVTKLNEQTSKIDGIGTEEPLASQPQGQLRDVPAKNDLGVKGAELANTANPIFPDSRGEDQRKKVTPEWEDGKGLRELVYMKHNLYNLEVKLNSNPKFGAYGEEAPAIKKIQTQIDALKHKIDELSNSLSPDFIQQELS